MKGRATIVLDVGKTLAKLSLWSSEGALIERRARPNERIKAGAYVALDTAGIEGWVVEAHARERRVRIWASRAVQLGQIAAFGGAIIAKA